MAWGDNGVTNLRRMIDQSWSVNWGNTLVRIPTKALSQVGYLKRVIIKIPVQGGTITCGGTVTTAAQAAIQRPTGRAVNNVDITAQGISPFYQLSKGQDVLFLEYVNNGKMRFMDTTLGAMPDVAPAASVGTLGRTSAAFGQMGYDVATAPVNTGVQNVRISATYDMPITEWVRFPAYTQKTDKGMISVPAQEVEVGIITLQNTQQNITPHITLNPLYSATVDSPLLQSNGAPTGTIPLLIEFWSEFYDVPQGPQNQPPQFSQMFIVARQTADDGAIGGTCTHGFQAAGLLLRAIYCAYDSSDNLVDISNQAIQAITTYPLPAQANEGNIVFKWGSTVIKYNDRFSINLLKAFDNYGEPPPIGALFHDFFRDRSVTDVINTAALTAPQCVITGLPASVATVHTIEQRMIPVQLDRAT